MIARTSHRDLRRVLALVASASPCQPAARAETVADFYRGKTIELLIGGAVGGGYDLAGRTVASHIGRHIPGNPTFVVRNMPGATSLIMTNHLYNVAKRDGTVIGMPHQQHSARAAAEADFARRRQREVRHRAVQLDRHAGAGAAGHLGLAHRAGAQLRRSPQQRDPHGRHHVVGRQLYPADDRQPGARHAHADGDRLHRAERDLSRGRARRGAGQQHRPVQPHGQQGGLAARRQGPHPAAIRRRAAAELPDVPTAVELAPRRSRPRAAAVLRREVQHGAPAGRAARRAGGAGRGAARRVRRHHEGPAISGGGPAHRPRRQSARRRGHRGADPAGAGDAAAGRRPAARIARRPK